MRRFDISVGLLSLAVISWGAGFVYSRERFHETDLQALYQRINADSFNGTLPKADVHWDALGEHYGETVPHHNWAEILIDRALVTDDQQLLTTLRYESCHAYVGTLDVKEEPHGPTWSVCMERCND